MEKRLDKKIAKYKEILNTLKLNQQDNEPGDDYPYDIDIKNTKEFIRDLNSIKYGK